MEKEIQRSVSRQGRRSQLKKWRNVEKLATNEIAEKEIRRFLEQKTKTFERAKNEMAIMKQLCLSRCSTNCCSTNNH